MATVYRADAVAALEGSFRRVMGSGRMASKMRRGASMRERSQTVPKTASTPTDAGRPIRRRNPAFPTLADAHRRQSGDCKDTAQAETDSA